jgi:hypothetical protein
MRGELPSVAIRSRARESVAEIAWSRFLAVISNRDLKLLVGFCTIGYLLAINMIVRFPDFGEAAAALAILP